MGPSCGHSAATHRLLGNAYFARLDRHDLAFDHYAEAEKIYSDTNDLYSLAEVWHQLALICLRDGNTRVAQEAWQTATMLTEHLGYDDLSEDLALMAAKHGLTSDAIAE